MGWTEKIIYHPKIVNRVEVKIVILYDRQKFFVDFDEDAEIHFGVSLYLKDAEVKIVDK